MFAIVTIRVYTASSVFQLSWYSPSVVVESDSQFICLQTEMQIRIKFGGSNPIILKSDFSISILLLLNKGIVKNAERRTILSEITNSVTERVLYPIRRIYIKKDQRFTMQCAAALFELEKLNACMLCAFWSKLDYYEWRWVFKFRERERERHHLRWIDGCSS